MFVECGVRCSFAGLDCGKECETSSGEDLELCYSEADRAWKDDCLAICSTNPTASPGMKSCREDCRLRYGVELDMCFVAMEKVVETCHKECDTAREECRKRCSTETASPN